MANLKNTIETLVGEGVFDKIVSNRVAQFGRPNRRYLGATILPERLVANNRYEEMNIRYRTVVANDASRYSPAQKKGNDIVGKMEVTLAEQDIASEFTSEDYDNYLQYDKLNSYSPENSGNPGMLGMTQIAKWFDNRIVLPLVEKVEKMRWEAIVDASVPLTGDNNYADTITFPNPAGHRVAAGGDWADPSYNPLDDLFAQADAAAAKGYQLSRWITSRPILYALLRNPNVSTQVGGYISVNGAGNLVGANRYTDLNALNLWLASNGLPAIETYDLQYRTQLATNYFLKRDVFVGICNTGQDSSWDLGDNESLFVKDAAGYVAIGRAAGQPTSGRAYSQQYFENKPPRVEFEGWQTSCPVITDPESIYVINSITTAGGGSGSGSGA